MLDLASTFLVASVLLWTAALIVGAGDGLYYHFLKLRLYSRPESRREHLAHTLRAALLLPTLWTAYLAPHTVIAPRTRLLAFVVLVLADWIVGAWDVYLERKSRKETGGLPHLEYVIHVAATALHSSAETFALCGLLVSDDGVRPELVSNLGMVLLIGGALVLLLHLAALARPRSLVTKLRE